MDGFIMAYIESMIQAKPHCHTENQGFGYLWLSKNSTCPQKLAKAKPSFRKVNLPTAKL